jgi:hypothetical protein
LNSLLASIKRVLFSSLFFARTKIVVAIEVPKKRLSGRAMTASTKLLSTRY